MLDAGNSSFRGTQSSLVEIIPAGLRTLVVEIGCQAVFDMKEAEETWEPEVIEKVKRV